MFPLSSKKHIVNKLLKCIPEINEKQQVVDQLVEQLTGSDEFPYKIIFTHCY